MTKQLENSYNGSKAPDFSSQPETVKAVKEIKPPDIPPKRKFEIELPGWEKKKDTLTEEHVFRKTGKSRL